MSDIDTVEYVGLFEFVNFEDYIPEDHFARFVVMFVKSFLKFFYLENEIYVAPIKGRPKYSLVKMYCLIYYAFAEGITDSKKIEYNAKYNKIYAYVCNGIQPSYKTIDNFIDEWGTLIEYFVAYTINFARIAGFTGMEQVAFDGTVMKAANNKFNVVHRSDVKVLLRFYQGKVVSRRELKKLRRPAKKILNRLDMTNRQKIDFLNKIMERFEETGKNTIPVNDIEAIHITDKKGKKIIGYNIQTAVDSMSKMFCAILLTQKATDHDQFPAIFEKAVDNIGKDPDKSSADAAYNTYETLEYIDKNNIDALIFNTRLAKFRNGHKNKWVFHKDNMIFNYIENYFKCYAGNPLFYQDTKVKFNEKTNKTEVKAEFYNKKACAACIFKRECCKGKKYRKVIVSGGELALKMEEKMLNYESICEYMKRFFTVEPPNGSLSTYYHINEILTCGTDKIQKKLSLIAGGYNLKRLYNEWIKNYGSISFFEDTIKQIHKKTKACMYINTYNRLKRNNTLLLPA